jgi:hypothetical protein
VDSSPPFGALDFVYMPSRDVAADRDWLVTHLKASELFAIDAMDTRVAMLALSDGAPRILLTDHLETDAPVLVYRVADLKAHLHELGERSVEGRRIELPMGPAFSLTTPGGQRIAIYEPTRAEVQESFLGRHDF